MKVQWNESDSHYSRAAIRKISFIKNVERADLSVAIDHEHNRCVAKVRKLVDGAHILGGSLVHLERTSD